MQISERLKTVASFVSDGMRVADIGTDHGYVPIYLIQNGRIPSAIAVDVGKGPLARAAEHIAEQGLSDRIETRLSDGFSALEKGEIDAVVIAGLGGELMIQILSLGRAVISNVSELILSPHSEIHKVRQYLMDQGFFIIKETMVFEEGKYYTIMKAVYGQGDYVTEPEIWYGKRLLEEQNPVLKEYLCKELKTRTQIEEKLAHAKNETARARRMELAADTSRLQEALGYYKPE